MDVLAPHLMSISQVAGESSWAEKHSGVAPELALASTRAPEDKRRDMVLDESE